jgi:hypothetical protein
MRETDNRCYRRSSERPSATHDSALGVWRTLPKLSLCFDYAGSESCTRPSRRGCGALRGESKPSADDLPRPCCGPFPRSDRASQPLIIDSRKPQPLLTSSFN